MTTPKKLFAVAAVLAAVAGSAFTIGGRPGAVGSSTSAVASPGPWHFDTGGAFRFWDSRSNGYSNPGGILPTGVRHVTIPLPWFDGGNVTSITFNVTVVVPDQPAANGWISIYPFTYQNTSVINWDRPGEYANQVFVPLAYTNEGLGFYILVAGSGPVHIILDVQAWTT